MLQLNRFLASEEDKSLWLVLQIGAPAAVGVAMATFNFLGVFAVGAHVFLMVGNVIKATDYPQDLAYVISAPTVIQWIGLVGAFVVLLFHLFH